MFKDIALENEIMAHTDKHSVALKVIFAVCVCALCILSVYALMLSDAAAPILRDISLNQLALSGVENPVTAVLLNYRSYDTLLEIAILYVVVLSLYACLFDPISLMLAPLPVFESQPIVRHFLRAFVPLVILVGGYFLWTGAYEPGGAFQAGAILASGFIMVRVVGEPINYPQWIDSVCIVLGVVVFVLTALLVAITQGLVLYYPADFAAIIILIIEIAATISITVSLYIFYRMLVRA